MGRDAGLRDAPGDAPSIADAETPEGDGGSAADADMAQADAAPSDSGAAPECSRDSDCPAPQVCIEGGCHGPFDGLCVDDADCGPVLECKTSVGGPNGTCYGDGPDDCTCAVNNQQNDKCGNIGCMAWSCFTITVPVLCSRCAFGAGASDLGEDCLKSTHCGYHLRCEAGSPFGTCIPRLPDGAPCKTNGDCEEELVCAPSDIVCSDGAPPPPWPKTCRPPTQAGDPCCPLVACAAGLTCAPVSSAVGSGTACRAPGEAGAPCTLTGDCAGELVCLGPQQAGTPGNCSPRGSAGDICWANAHCEPPFVCGGVDGDPMTADAPGACDIPIGKACETNGVCGAGAHCATTVGGLSGTCNGWHTEWTPWCAEPYYECDAFASCWTQCFYDFEVQGPFACDECRPLPGSQGLGRVCASSVDCQPELRCAPGLPWGRCEAPLPAGAPCAEDRDCAGTLACSGDEPACAVGAGAGEPCSALLRCATDLACSSVLGQCVQPGTAYAPCAAAPCAAGHVCGKLGEGAGGDAPDGGETTSLCLPKCGPTQPCPEPLVCVTVSDVPRCRLPLGLHEWCTSSSECAPPLTCGSLPGGGWCESVSVCR